MISFLRNARKGEKLGTTEYSSLLFSPLGLTPVDSFVFGVIQEVILDFPVASKLPNHRVWILCLTGPPVLQPRWWHLRSGPHTSPVPSCGPPSSHPSASVITVTLRWAVVSRWTPLCSLHSPESRLYSAFTLGCWPFLPPISHGLCFSPTGRVLLPDHAVSVSQFLLPLATVLTTRSEGSHPKCLQPPLSAEEAGSS